MNGEITKLSKGWVRTRLDAFAEIVLGQSPPSSTYNEVGNGLSFYQGKLEFGDMYPTPCKWCTSPRKIAEKGDVLISVRAPVGPTNICPERSCIGRGLAAIRGLGGVETHFILYLMRAHGNLLSGMGTGTTFNAITGDKLKGIQVPLSPLPEQHRIVAKIEELFTKLDAGVEALKKIKSQLRRYRQSVLKYAFEGKLTVEWRQAHKDELEPASTLLERIKQERLKTANSKYKELPPMDISYLPKLPEGWVWTIGDIVFSFVTSGSRGWAKYYSESGPVFLRIGNLDHDSISLDLGSVQRVCPPPSVEGFRTRVTAGDILISITGDVGMIALIPEGFEEAYINQHVALARPVSVINKSYMAWFLSSREGGHHQFLKLQRGATKMGLGLDDIRSVNIPIAPLVEQQQIISEIERRFSVADQIEKTVDHGLKQAERLRQSILKRVFEGKLVPQDPNDEPAEKLLERIRQERARQQVERKPAKSSRNKSNTKQMRLV